VITRQINVFGLFWGMTNWVARLTGETQARLLALLRRSGQTITALARALHLTDNAVRLHVAALRRDGIVRDIGAVRDTGGKPARIYGLTPEGEELFPKAYAPVLAMFVEEVTRRDGRARAVELLRTVGRRLAAGAGTGLDAKQRVAAAADVLRDLGADVEVQRTPEGWRVQGYGCPLAAVSGTNEDVCELGKALVEEITGAPVTECCERGENPRCAFTISV
jgi:DeoR family suf operon transcriptional repressor